MTLARTGTADSSAPPTMKNGPIPVSLSDTNQAVAVVPTFEPSSTPRLARKEITAASTRAVVSAVIALLDCTTAVASAPIANPRHRLPPAPPPPPFHARPPAAAERADRDPAPSARRAPSQPRFQCRTADSLEFVAEALQSMQEQDNR